MKFTKSQDGNLMVTFESNINVDNGYTNASQGIKISEMELFTNDNETPTGIEWIVNDGEFVEGIGLWFDGRTLTDYDGVFELPKEAIKLIRKAGYRVPKEMYQF